MPTTKCGFDNTPAGSGSDLLCALGPTLWAHIGFDPAYDPDNAAQLPRLPNPPLPALVDTGASECCIDSVLAVALALPIIDRRPVSGVHGAADVNMHLAQIHVAPLRFTIYGVFAGVDLIAGGQAHHALIGRSFLRGFTMTYEGRSGTVVISND
jgi:hypothetical protein